MTTKELAKQYQDEADASSHRNGLWKGAYAYTAKILRGQHRSRAIRRLENLAKQCEKMSVSSVYAGAANQLKEDH